MGVGDSTLTTVQTEGVPIPDPEREETWDLGSDPDRVSSVIRVYNI